MSGIISDLPRLHPTFCFNETALRDFLRLSRSSLDDTITSTLNSLSVSSSSSPQPSTFSSSFSTPRRKSSISNETCNEFQSKILFPTWQARSDVLTYCGGVANSPDPDDPELGLRVIEDAKAKERVVDERLDPYSGRYFPREGRRQRLVDVLRNETMIEDIVRERTWRTVIERCGNGFVEDADKRWSVAFNKWRTEN